MNAVFATSRLLAAALVAAGLAGINIWGNTAHAAEAGHDHGHAAAAAKPLPAGKRWTTDAPLREGMMQIRQSLEPKLGAIHKDKLAADEYKAIAEHADKQIANIVANCKLPPDADAALHGIIARVGEGTEAMAGKSKLQPREGAIKVVEALEEYGRTFDHPRWKRLHA
jgi:hypothetical protein